MAEPYTLSPAPTTGVDAEQTLIGLLQRIGSLQNEPLVPANPYAQAGTILSGFASGFQGRPNPTVEMFRQQRQQELTGLSQQAGIAGSLATIAQQRQQRKEREEARVDETLSAFLKSDSSTARVYAAQAIQTRLRAKGVEIPDEVVVGMGAGRLKLDDFKEVALLTDMGLPDAQVSQITGVPLSGVNAVRNALMSDDARKLLDLPSAVDRRLKNLEEQNKLLSNANLAMPGVPKEVIPHALRLFPNKDPRDLTTKEWSQASDAYLKHQLEEAKLSAGVQPVSGDVIRMLSSAEMAVSALTAAQTLVNDPKRWGVAKEFIGPPLTGGAVREAMVRNLPSSMVGEVPPELTDLGFAEDQYKNLLVLARSGSAVTPQEFDRQMKEAPSRSQDKPEVYLRKLPHALRVSKMVMIRMQKLSGVGGRAAVNPVDVIRENPLPSPPQQVPTTLFFNPKTGAYASGPVDAKPPEGWVKVQ